MSIDRPRRPVSARDKAEALFSAATPKAAAPAPPRPAVPGARELVSLRIDSDVLEHFQSDGPGWQDRINDALRRAAGL
ncbi:BrnA antitoxin family protein [Bosea sp. 124]|uniref:BrnA antitoxin family protein n=1 Tax=Bosea sp. 124 TaxID=2135642 RepID=UPI000D3B027D|nr:BrnA antitoxin family protein [Bosea sp. 124]PTM43272.1 BrnA antitoxin of type II toxin-antitoxin system [Bosea sp. 124]